MLQDSVKTDLNNSYTEWSKIQTEIEMLQAQQKDIMDDLKEKYREHLNINNVKWAFQRNYKSDKEQHEQNLEEKVTMFEDIFE